MGENELKICQRLLEIMIATLIMAIFRKTLLSEELF